MWNETDTELEVASSTARPEYDESAYSIFFSTYNRDSPVYSNNITDFGISINLMKFCLEGVGITTVSVLGVIGNILSMMVLSSPRMKSSSSCFLTALAICDIVTLVGATLLLGIPSLLAYIPSPGKAALEFNEHILEYGYLVPGLFALSCTGLTGSIGFMLALTFERYLAVCRPFFARYLCTWSRACFVSAIVMLLSILYNFPKWFEYTYVVEESNNITTYRPVPTALRKNPVYDTYYVHVSYAVLCFFIPICLLIVFNILIYCQIKEANKMRKDMSPSQKHEYSITRMLFGVVAVFLVCQLAPVFHILYRYIDGSREFVPEAEFFWCFMLVLNSSVNFLIYCASGGKFREIFCDKFCCWRTSTRLRQFAASTKTTFRSWSSSSNSRSRIYSIYSRGGGTLQKNNEGFEEEATPVAVDQENVQIEGISYTSNIV